MAEIHRIRTRKMQIWLLEEEYQMLTKNAFEFDLSKSEYIRQLIFYGGLVGRQWTMDKEQARQLIYELNCIGNNLNQIAYNTNIRRFADNEDWKAVKENYIEFLTLFGKIPFLKFEEQNAWRKLLNELCEKQLNID